MAKKSVPGRRQSVRQTRTLVLSHLENAQGELFDVYSKQIQSRVRGKVGIYALYKRDRLYYVGLASSLGGRLKQHQRDRHAGKWDRFSVYITSSDKHLRELEALALRLLRPKGNRQRGKLRGSKDLKPELKRDLSAHARRYVAGLLGSPRLQPVSAITVRTPSARRLSSARKPGPAPFTLGKRAAIRATHQGVDHRAVLHADGSVTMNGKKYNSVSAAASKVVKRRACNGKYFWRAKVRSGEWLRLRELK